MGSQEHMTFTSFDSKQLNFIIGNIVLPICICVNLATVLKLRISADMARYTVGGGNRLAQNPTYLHMSEGKMCDFCTCRTLAVSHIKQIHASFISATLHNNGYCQCAWTQNSFKSGSVGHLDARPNLYHCTQVIYMYLERDKCYYIDIT